MGMKGMKSLRSRFRTRLSGLRTRLRAKRDGKVLEESVPVDSTEIQSFHQMSWVRKTSFRSSITLNGSSKIYIWFESVQDTGVRFSLDMETGVLSDLENWEEDIEMPGGSEIDPEPLSVWGIDSADERVNIIMNVDRFDDLFVDGKAMDIAHFPSVLAIVGVLRNVVVRDIWLEAWKN